MDAVCKRSAACRCKDCAAASAAFSINDLRALAPTRSIYDDDDDTDSSSPSSAAAAAAAAAAAPPPPSSSRPVCASPPVGGIKALREQQQQQQKAKRKEGEEEEEELVVLVKAPTGEEEGREGGKEGGRIEVCFLIVLVVVWTEGGRGGGWSHPSVSSNPVITHSLLPSSSL